MDEKINLFQYAEDVRDGKILVCSYVKLAVERFYSFLQRDDIEFRADKAYKFIKFCSKLRHFTGAHAGKPFQLENFQIFLIVNIFCFYYKGTNNRVTRNVYIELARKNGKTFLAAAICLYCMIADGEPNAEVELMANSSKQASICFEMCRNLAEGLDKKKKFFNTFRDKIRFPHTKSSLQILSNNKHSNDGWNSYCFIVDEYHEAPDSSSYDVLASSQGARQNPLAVVITTAGFNLYGPCYKMRQTNVEILEGKKNDDSQFTVIYTLDANDDWKDPNVWIKSNPNLGVSVVPDNLKRHITQAINNPDRERDVRTKDLNQWVSSKDVWISNDNLLECTESLQWDDFVGCDCYIGVDLSEIKDLTAVSYLFVKDGKFYFKTRYYLPQYTIENNENRWLYNKFKEKGELIACNGKAINYDQVLSDIVESSSKYRIISITYDAWNAREFNRNAVQQGLPMDVFSQSLLNFNIPTKELQRNILVGNVIIDDNELTRWCFSNVQILYDSNNNFKPVKDQKCAYKKIDGVIAMIMAMAAYLTLEAQSNKEIFIL